MTEEKEVTGNLEISISSADVQSHINSTISQAVKNSLESYTVSSAIGSKITESIIEGSVSQALDLAIRNLDTQALTNMLAAEIQRTVTRAVVAMLQEGFVDILAKMKGLSNYSDDDKKERARLKEQLFNKLYMKESK